MDTPSISTAMKVLPALAVASLLALGGEAASANASSTSWPSAFTVPGAFPTSLFSSYYNNPTQTSAQVQPVISDPVLVRPAPVLASYTLLAGALVD